MINLGIIGLNEGNGHPFSYSAIFNGYDHEALEKRCPYELIREYLSREHRNENLLDSAKVTHIWTQEKKLSEDVAAVSKIPNIVDEYTDLIGMVDAVILSRDDVANHLEMMRPFLQKKVPLFIDKQLVATKDELDEFMKLSGPEYLFMAGSSVRYTRDLAKAKRDLQLGTVQSIHGVSRESWMRYGHHLFEGIVALWGLDIDWVRSLSHQEDHDIVQVHYGSGPNVTLEFIKDAHLPIQFTVYSTGAEPYVVPFTDYFYSFREILKTFVSMVATGKPGIPHQETLGIAKVILAGDISKQNNGIAVSPATLEPIDSMS
ncbi:MAG: hypothetical protein HY454_02290 [Parcubacteria group bacterium]|nr:hypothetical protein [Parcubacteria group bacterium]